MLDAGLLVEQETLTRLTKSHTGERMKASWTPVRCILQSQPWSWHLSFTFMSLLINGIYSRCRSSEQIKKHIRNQIQMIAYQEVSSRFFSHKWLNVATVPGVKYTEMTNPINSTALLLVLNSCSLKKLFHSGKGGIKNILLLSELKD